jgi:hypothetical protein
MSHWSKANRQAIGDCHAAVHKMGTPRIAVCPLHSLEADGAEIRLIFELGPGPTSPSPRVETMGK